LRLDQARKICEEIKQKYGITFSDYKEEQREGKIRLVSFTARFWINEETVDISGNCDNIK
jgi:hypothetical protein